MDTSLKQKGLLRRPGNHRRSVCVEMLNTRSLLRRRILTAANRMMSTYRVGFSFRNPRSPWLVVEPSLCKPSSIKFWCNAEQKEYKFIDLRGGDLVAPDMKLLGSSPGWLACQRPDGATFLLDPVTFDGVHLPPWIHRRREVETLVFSDSEGKAFVIFRSGHSLAFCSTDRLGDGWSLFGGALDKYESMVYSTAHRRLFCITSALKLEAWDVGHDPPRLDWVAHYDNPYQPSPDRPTLKYLACDEQSGQLFLVVRHVSKSGEDLTVDFKVYRIDQGLNVMRGWLEGMTFFVGNNQAIAMRDGFGVEPDSVYFTYDKRLRYNTVVGNFDYRRKSISPVSCPFAANPYPVWFMAHPRHIIAV
ncbi:hypothetical protein OROHE_009516 [Orobanche hederae]